MSEVNVAPAVGAATVVDKIPTKIKLTGLFTRTGKYGEFWTGTDAAGIEYTLSVNMYKENDEAKPEFILYKNNPDAPDWRDAKK